jgi:hypothetical protein
MMHPPQQKRAQWYGHDAFAPTRTGSQGSWVRWDQSAPLRYNHPMAIDYVIDYPCTPKAELGTEGILGRLKDRERAQLVIGWFRDHGDERPPDQMGFEFTRAAPGDDVTQDAGASVQVVQDLLDRAAALDALAGHCAGCPANRTGEPFGCMGFMHYPVSAQAEALLLAGLPEDGPLAALLLRGIEAFGYDGAPVRALRQHEGTYFADPYAPARTVMGYAVTADQVWEMLIGVGPIAPNHGALLLLFSGAIRRDLHPQTIAHIAPAPPGAADELPFLLAPSPADDGSSRELKALLAALHRAWLLDVRLLLDP